MEAKIIRVYQHNDWLTLTEDSDGKVFYEYQPGVVKQKWIKNTGKIPEARELFIAMGRIIEEALTKFNN